MDALARDYADQARFLFIYTRETHPDTHPEWPVIQSIEQKFDHAKLVRDMHDSPRTFLVDGLDGEVHRAYSGCPNMSWVIDHVGRVHFKANWTREEDLRRVIKGVVGLQELRRDPDACLKQYFTEGVTYLRAGRPPKTESERCPRTADDCSMDAWDERQCANVRAPAAVVWRT